MDRYTFLSNATPEYLESLYNDFKANPTSVDPEFKKFFEGFDFATLHYANGKAASFSTDELKVYKLILAYRNKGHLIANTNPIKKRKDRHANLDLENFQLTEKDLDRKFSVGSEIGLANATLNEILSKLKKIYCSTLGFEFGYIRVKQEVEFFRNKIEKDGSIINFPVEKKERILLYREINY